jgi:uncharacterized protein (DUF1800 family)
MRLILILLFFISSTAIAVPLGYDDARLLLTRTGFSATEQEIKEFSQLSREQAADKLLQGVRTSAQTPPLAWVDDYMRPAKFKNLSAEQRKEIQAELFDLSVELRAWWMQEMLTTSSPLTEKMTLFWHNHFVSAQQKVKSPHLLYRQNILLRKYAVGNFSDLLHAVAKDPAMIIYLDNASNRKGQPNENFAREVMELFTLGEGNYSEQDIREAARAFTGWSIDLDSGDFRFRERQHDFDVKTVFGKSGNFNGDDVLDMLLLKPQAAEYITAKLWREFISPDPDKKEVKRLALIFRQNNYELKPLLRALFIADAFYAKENRAMLIKSPIELIVGTLHQFNFSTGELSPFLLVSRQLGQDIFNPPNVKGWPGGEVWINSATLLGRKQFLDRLFRSQEMAKMQKDAAMVAKGFGAGGGRMARFAKSLSDIHFDSGPWFEQFEGVPEQKIERAQKLVLATQPLQPIKSANSGLDLIRQMVLDPVYQLK